MHAEAPAAVPQQVRGGQHVVDQHGLVDVELEVALAGGEGHGGVVAVHLHRHLGQRLALGGVHLARHDGAAGLVGGQLQFAQPAARAAAQPAHVVGDLHQRSGQGAQGRGGGRQGLVRRQALELVRGLAQRAPGQFAQLGHYSRGEVRGRVEPRTHGRAADGQLGQPVQRGLQARHPAPHLSVPGADFLAQGHGHGILQVRAPDLHHSRVLRRLVRQRIVQGVQFGQQAVREHLQRGQVHGAGKRVVGGLGAVDVVVGVHPTRTHLRA